MRKEGLANLMLTGQIEDKRKSTYNLSNELMDGGTTFRKDNKTTIY